MLWLLLTAPCSTAATTLHFGRQVDVFLLLSPSYSPSGELVPWHEANDNVVRFGVGVGEPNRQNIPAAYCL